MYKGINAKEFKKVIDKMMKKYGEDIVFEWEGEMRIVDFYNNRKDCIR